MSYIVKLALIVNTCLFTSQSLAFGEISADEIRVLFSGNTVEGERRDGGKPGIDLPNTIESFGTPFTMYFDNDGTLIKKSGNKPNVGKWRTSDDAGLCMEWKGKKEKCAHVYKQGNVYKRTVRRRNGFILFEQTYVGFTSGNKIKQKN